MLGEDLGRRQNTLKAVLYEVNGSFGALGCGQERVCLAWRLSASKRPPVAGWNLYRKSTNRTFSAS